MIEGSKPYKYDIEISSHCECVREADKNDEWDKGDEAYDNYFRAIRKTRANYPDLVSSLDIKEGQTVYVVWYESSSGSSFGRSDRCNVEAVGIFSSKEPAEELKEHIKEHAAKQSNQLTITTSDGQFFDNYCDLYDYFGGLDEVHIEATIMQAKEKS